MGLERGSSGKFVFLESEKGVFTRVEGDTFNFSADCISIQIFTNFQHLISSVSHVKCNPSLLLSTDSSISFPNQDYMTITVPNVQFGGGRVEYENVGCGMETFPGLNITQGAVVVSIPASDHDAGFGYDYFDAAKDSAWRGGGNSYHIVWSVGDMPFDTSPGAPVIVVTMPGTTDWPRQELQATQSNLPDLTDGVLTTGSQIDRFLVIGGIDARDQATTFQYIEVSDPDLTGPDIPMPFPLGVDPEKVSVFDSSTPDVIQKNGADLAVYDTDIYGRTWYAHRDAANSTCGFFIFCFDPGFNPVFNTDNEFGELRSNPHDPGLFRYTWFGLTLFPVPTLPINARCAGGSYSPAADSPIRPKLSGNGFTFFEMGVDDHYEDNEYTLQWTNDTDGTNPGPQPKSFTFNHYRTDVQFGFTTGPHDGLPSFAQWVFDRFEGAPPFEREIWKFVFDTADGDADKWEFYVLALDTQAHKRDTRARMRLFVKDNHPPVIRQGQPGELQLAYVMAHDDPDLEMVIRWDDPDAGDDHTVQFWHDPGTGEVSGVPAFCTIVPDVDINHWNVVAAPGAGDVGNYDFRVKVTDDGDPNLADEKTWLLQVNSP